LLLLAEPQGHVKLAAFERELTAAHTAGLEVQDRLEIRFSQAAVLRKS
jgi:hypothetical protein